MNSLKWQIQIWQDIPGWEQDLAKTLKSKGIIYWCMADHIGEKEERPHKHIYIRYSQQHRQDRLQKRKHGTFSVNGTDEANANYIKNGKEDYQFKPTNFEEGGEQFQSKIHSIVQQIKKGADIYELMDNPMYTHSCVQYKRQLEEIATEAKKRQKIELMPFGYPTLLPYQAKIKQCLESPHNDTRRIHWFYDPRGNSGKSTFIQWACNMGLGTGVDIWKESRQITHDITKECRTFPKIVMADVPCSERKIAYSLLECLKNGCIRSEKYDNTKLSGPPAKIIIASNFEPNYAEMTANRWIIYDLRPDGWHIRYK